MGFDSARSAMGNHSIDCPHCGVDQRSAGSACCENARVELERFVREFRAEQADRQALFERHGIEFFKDWKHYGDRVEIPEIVPRPSSVADFLRKLELADGVEGDPGVYRSAGCRKDIGGPSTPRTPLRMTGGALGALDTLVWSPAP